MLRYQQTIDMERLCVYPEDVQKITGKGLRYAQKLLKTIRKEYHKTKRHAVTKKELAEHLGIDEGDIKLE